MVVQTIPNGQQVVAVVNGNTLVGGLAGSLVSRLRDCILAGTNFSAKVLSIRGPVVMVSIEPT